MDTRKDGRQHEPRLKKLEFTEPNADGDVIAIANVSFGNKPAENIPVEFFYKDMLVPDSIEITKEGRAVKKFFGLKPGVYTVAARIQGSMSGNTESFRIEDPKKNEEQSPGPMKISLEDTGSGLKHKLLFTVTKEGNDKKPVSGVRITIVDSGRMRKLPATNENGSAECSLSLEKNERHRIILYKIIGSEKFEEVHLFPH